MVRPCCVLNCTSKNHIPSNAFPTNPQMREKWLKSLILKPYKENEINCLKVCYKHFKESDYTGSPKLRRLNRTAVPFITTEVCTTQFNNIIQHQEQSIQQNQETITIVQENVAQLQKDEVISRQQEIIGQIQEDIEGVSQQEKHQDDFMQLQTNIDELSQMQAQHNNQLQKVQEVIQEVSQQQKKHQDNFMQLQTNIDELSQRQTQHELSQMQVQMQIQMQIQMQAQEIESLKMQLYKNLQTRPNLGKITRKRTLSPIAKKFYDNYIKLQKRRMKRTMNKMKQQNICKNLKLNRRKYKNQEDETTNVREQIGK